MVLTDMTEEYVEELISKFARGSATKKEIETLMEWYQSASIDEVEWAATDPREKNHLYDRMLDRLKMDILPKKNRIMHLPWVRVAAIAILFVGVATVITYFLNRFPGSYITVANPPGKIQLVRLPDSSRVWLNASSTIKYRKSFRQNRELELEGEAYFEVKHDDRHPFIVKTGNIQTIDLGTSFDIKAYGSYHITTVSLISGRVRVTAASKDLAVLMPSHQLQYDRETHRSKIVPIDTVSLLAWKMGKWQFQGQTLGEIARTLETWYNVKFIFTNPTMESCRYYMSFENTISLEKLLPAMAEITQMQYSFEKNSQTVTLSGPGCR